MILVFLAPGFEESEAIVPLDILRRAGLDAVTVSVGVGADRTVTGSHGVTVQADISSEELPECLPEMLVLPGGMPGTKHLDSSLFVREYLEKAYTKGAYIAAICASPMVLGKQGLLIGKKATCYPGFEQYLTGAEVGGKVVRDGKIITGRGMGVAVQFGLALVETLCGGEKAEAIREAICAD